MQHVDVAAKWEWAAKGLLKRPKQQANLNYVLTVNVVLAKTVKQKRKRNSMCATCGCGQPKNKHGEKTISAANKKFAKKKPIKKVKK